MDEVKDMLVGSRMLIFVHVRDVFPGVLQLSVPFVSLNSVSWLL